MIITNSNDNDNDMIVLEYDDEFCSFDDVRTYDDLVVVIDFSSKVVQEYSMTGLIILL